MIRYEDLYEFLRREKSNEQLQALPNDFVKNFSEYMHEHRRNISRNGDFFADEIIKEKKQYENSMTIFRELMLRRKKKILNLVFVAAESGVMKRDFDDMLAVEKDLFEKLVLAVDSADKSVASLLLDGSFMEDKEVFIKEDVESFVDMSGGMVGPFKKGQSLKIDKRVAEVLIAGEKAMWA